MTSAPLCLPPRPVPPPGSRGLPRGSCDCHSHVFPAGFPLSPARGYTPSPVNLADYDALRAAFGIGRGVLVQPSVYGFDNDALYQALAGRPDLRGIAVIPPDAPDEAFAEAQAHGIRGLRVNALDPAGLRLEHLGPIARRIAPLGWHLQIHMRLADLDTLDAIPADLPLVLDHFAFPDLAGGAEDPGFRRLVALLETGRAWLKLSAPYRQNGPLQALAPIVARLVEAAPERLLWGLDWPHSACFDTVPDDVDLVDAMLAWLPGEALRHQVLVANPAGLYFGM
jgi:2-pyrone-4,6-dicarboxylate lactonase